MPSYIEGVTFSGVVETLRWGDFLTLVTAKQLSMEYAQSTDSYTIWAIDGPITYTCQLVFASASANYPFPMSDGYTAAQNNTDVATFTTTYQSTSNLNANTPYGAIGATAPITGSLAGGIDTTGKLRAAGVAAASTAVVATQPAFAVGLSPNSPLPAGTNVLGGVTQSGAWSVTVSSISGTVAVTQSTSPWIVAGAGTAGTPGTAVLTVQGITGGTPQPVSGTVAISGTVAVTQSTSPWVTSISTALPTGANTIGAVTQASGPWTQNLTQVGGAAIALGQAAMAASIPVAIASNQTALPVSQSGAWTVAATQSGAWTTGRTWTLASGTDSVSAVQSGAWTVAATQSGTWTVQPGNTANTTPWLTTDTADGPVTPGAVATKSQLVGVQFNTALPTLTNTQQAAVQSDSSGRLLVGSIASALPAGANVIGAVTQSAGPWTQNLTQVGGSAIALGQTTMAASLPVTIASNQTALPVSQSGAWTVAVSGTVAVTQSTSPWIVAGGGTAGTPGTAVLTVQGITGGTPVPVSGTVTAANASVSTIGATAPTSGTLISGVDLSGNLRAPGTTAASTAATAAQLALVVGLSPNSPLPAGTNALGSVTVTGTVAVTQSTSPWVTSRNWTLASGTDSVSAVQSGTWTVQPGNTANTTPWLVTDSSDGPVTPGAVATKSSLAGVQFNTALPTLTNTQQAALQSDSSGRLLVGSIASALPTGANVIGAVTQSGAWTVAVSGTVAVTQSTSPWIVAGGGTAGAPGTAVITVQGITGGTPQPVVGTGTAGTPGTAVLTVQGIAGGTAQPIAGTGTDNSANSTTKLPVLAAVATTAAPTYTNTNMVPLSTDLAGNLRITGSISATNPSVSATGAAPPASATYIGGSVTTAAPSYTTGQMSALSLTLAGALRVDGSAVTQPVSGTVTANQGTANTVANAWPHKITDGTNVAAVKAASTAAVAADPSLVVALSPNTALPTGANTIGIVNQGTAATTANAWPHKITDGTNVAAVKAASTTPVAADPALVVSVSPNSASLTVAASADTTASGALGALNAAVTVAMTGQRGVAMQLSAGTLIGTLTPEFSVDGGTTWGPAAFVSNAGTVAATLVFASANTAQMQGILVDPGTSNVRVRVSAYTSGTANAAVRATANAGAPVQFSGGSQQVAEVSSRTLTGVYHSAMSAFQAGAASAQNLLSIENPTGSTITVYVKRAQFMGIGNGANNVSTFPLYQLTRTTAVPTGGTTQTAQKRRTTDATPQAIVRTGPTATAASGLLWAGSPGFPQQGNRSGTAPIQIEALRGLHEDDDITLAAGEAILFLVTTNDTNWQHLAMVSWQEGSGGW